jgi:AAA15 family ATPase/GTPase
LFFKDSQVVKINENTRLLRFAIIYGYNASGKSNLLKVFDFLSEFWFAKQDDVDKKTGIIPFKLDQVSPLEHSFIELVFFVEGIKYCYQLELDNTTIYLEKLSFYKTIKPVTLFERRLENGQSVISYPSKDLKLNNAVKETILVRCLKNMSFFAARNQVNTSIPLIDQAKDWLRNQIMPTITPSIQLTKYAQKNAINNSKLTEYIIDFLHEADFNITNINTNEQNEAIPDDILKIILNMDDVSTEEKERINEEKSLKLLKTEFEHTVENERGKEKYYCIPCQDAGQSVGLRRGRNAFVQIFDGNEMLKKIVAERKEVLI